MSYTKEQLVEVLTPGLVRETRNTAAQVRSVPRVSTIEQLDAELTRQRRAGFLRAPAQDVPQQTQPKPVQQTQPQIMGDQGREDLAWVHISRVPVNGKMVIDNVANRQIIFSWLHEDQGEQPTVQWFLKVMAEQPSLAKQIAWERIISKQERDQQESRQLAQDKKTFQDAAKS